MVNIKRGLSGRYHNYKWKFQTWQFNRYRKRYDSYSFNHKVKLANKWLVQYPEQAHFDINPINYWFENIVVRPTSVLESGDGEVIWPRKLCRLLNTLTNGIIMI